MYLELARLEEAGAGPFRPGPSGYPPYLAGREREQGLFRGLLARLDRGEAPPSEVILYGPRGNGKTVLLEWISEFASGSTGVDVEELTPSEFDSPTRLAELLLPAGWWKTLKPDEIGVRGITRRPGKRSAPPDPVEVLALRAARKPLVVLLDEAHTLDPGVGRSLLNAAQKVRRSAPFLLVLAGTPNLRAHLGTMGASFWNRSRKLRIGRLDERATADAIREPLEAEDLVITDEALEHLVRESHGYPFFVQLWGGAVWARAIVESRREIGVDDARTCQAVFDEQRDDYYSDRFHELDDSGLLQPARAVAETFRSRPVLSGSELKAAIRRGFGEAAGDDEVAAAAREFRHLGFVWQAGAMPEWEPGIPSLMDYMLRAVPAP